MEEDHEAIIAEETAYHRMAHTAKKTDKRDRRHTEHQVQQRIFLR